MGRLLDEDDIIKEFNEYASIWMEYHADMTQEEVAEAALNAAKRTMVHILEEMPSALPEIIRCKDCKYRMPYDWMFSEIWRSQNINDYSEDEIGCEYCDMTMKADDFCSRAERREE